MLEWIDENAIWVVVMCALTTAILVGGWIQTGKRILMFLAAIPVLMGLGTLVLQQFIVTDREEVQATLYRIAAAVESNDVESTLSFVDPESLLVAQQARGELPKYRFDEVNVKRNLEITLHPDESPPRAVAEFNVTVVVSERSGALQNQRVPRFAVVTFLKRDGKWRVSAYEHHAPQQSMMKRE